MRRIAGIFNFCRRPVDQTDIERMLNASVSQPHDGQVAWMKAGIGVGWIQKWNESNGTRTDMPSLSTNDQCIIVLDGRIDNRQELLAKLESQSTGNPRFISDEELVQAAYLEWGREFVRHLCGDFALAIWDKNNDQLICVRDHFGVKPLYYTRNNETFLFASTPTAILASGIISVQIDEARIADFLIDRLEGIDTTTSFYKDVYRLPPAHMLIVSSIGMTVERYWDLAPTGHMGDWSERDHIDRFLELFEGAVRCRLMNLDLPSSMLSGGMDTSSIVGMGRKVVGQLGKDLHVFAALSDSLKNNRETSHINSVLNQGNVQPHLISETNFAQGIDRIVNALELESDPFDWCMNLNRSVCATGHDLGVEAILDGVAGDTLLSDSGYLISLWLQGKIRLILNETIWASGMTAEYGLGKSELVNSFMSTISLFAPGWMERIRHHYLYQRLVEKSIRETVIDREFAMAMRIGERFTRFYAQDPQPASFDQIEFHKIALRHTDITAGLERYERVASFFNIDACHPLMDIRLAEYCISLPWHLKTWHGWTKIILRRAMESYLPSDVVWRCDKDSLMWEYNRLIFRNKAGYFYQVTCDESENLKPYVNWNKLAKFWQEYLTAGDEKHVLSLWSGVALAFWLRRHRNMMRDWSLGK
jgi:asparagine synthase (glutamine-hydrolysing)